MKKEMYKSGYFWGFLLGVIFATFNVLALPITYQQSENKILEIEFSKVIVKTLGGESVTLKELSNSKNVLINFWATWCRPCLVELPIMQSAYDNLKDNYVFVMIGDESTESTLNFLNNKGYSFEFVRLDRSFFIDNGILERPTTVILDSQLNIKEVVIGEIVQKNGEELTNFINVHNK